MTSHCHQCIRVVSSVQHHYTGMVTTMAEGFRIVAENEIRPWLQKGVPRVSGNRSCRRRRRDCT